MLIPLMLLLVPGGCGLNCLERSGVVGTAVAIAISVARGNIIDVTITIIDTC